MKHTTRKLNLYLLLFLLNLPGAAMADRRAPRFYRCDCTLVQYYEHWNSCSGNGTERWGSTGSDHSLYSTDCASQNWHYTEYPRTSEGVQCGVYRLRYSCSAGAILPYNPPLVDNDPAHQRTCHGRYEYSGSVDPAYTNEIGDASIYYLDSCSTHNTEYYYWWSFREDSGWVRVNTVWE